ncbi:hypothetical protein [Pseudomonas phage LUZ7]|uniref:Uncharacterized protein n=1 Tax=Pseudomonas phage LUZ7 TaxID=655097 RepID=C8ZKG0_9CAUD|nr:hypothetical protein PP-LUZ7_gp061 [Pseudomonas phage LUZ7]CAZ66202.1 hypothetical protein [Pseudomonas phage LUZ7]
MTKHPLCNNQHSLLSNCGLCRELYKITSKGVVYGVAIEGLPKGYGEAAQPKKAATGAAKPENRYRREIPQGWTWLDVYRLNTLFPITCDNSGAIDHARKKLLNLGNRSGGKSVRQDVKEARDSLNRWLEDNPEG